MNIADATHIVYPTRPVEMRVDLFLNEWTQSEGHWEGRLTMKQVTSIQDALETHVWCLPPGRLYVNGVCVCEFGRGLVTQSSDNQPETVQ